MIISLTPDLYQRMNDEVNKLRSDTSARCILLTDSMGNVLLKLGDLGGLPTEAITSLLCGGVATLLEAGKSIDDRDVINLAYREGKNSDLYAINIRESWVLIIVIDRGEMSTRLGTVWFYARKSVDQLTRILDEVPKGKQHLKLDAPDRQAYNNELEKLFK